MQLVGHVPYNLVAPIISLFLKRDVNKAFKLAKKLIEELDMDLRSRVSTSLAGH